MKYYLIHKILDKYEKSSVDWKEVQTGNRSIRIQQQDYDCLERLLRKQQYQGIWEENASPDEGEVYFTGKECLIKEVMWLEKQKLVTIKWRSFKNDIELLRYSLENISVFYKIAERVPKFEKVNAIGEIIRGYSEQVTSEWLQNYYREQIELADNGKKTGQSRFSIIIRETWIMVEFVFFSISERKSFLNCSRIRCRWNNLYDIGQMQLL